MPLFQISHTLSLLPAATVLGCWTVRASIAFQIRCVRVHHPTPPLSVSMVMKKRVSARVKTLLSAQQQVISFTSSVSSSDGTTTASPSSLTDIDRMYLQKALECAKLGVGHTFPNPAVGCVIVRQHGYGHNAITTTLDDAGSNDNNNNNNKDQMIGAGFHPRAGYPHAEIFALMQACGHIVDGVEAAKSVLFYYTQNSKNKNRTSSCSNRRPHPNPSLEEEEQNPSSILFRKVTALTDQYLKQGPMAIVPHENWFSSHKNNNDNNNTTTAYVTLEPCCHEGKTTPPCAQTLAYAGISRVVIGLRDPNPRVDGGGVKVLQEQGVQVLVVDTTSNSVYQTIVEDFCKRITPPFPTYDDMTGAKRSALRTLASRKKQDKTLVEVRWGGDSLRLLNDDDENDGEASHVVDRVHSLVLDPEWMENLDCVLWKQELVLVRLNQAVAKKRYSKLLGERIAQVLQAHVAQCAGHTVLLYRPGKPPVLDLEQVIIDRKSKSRNETVSLN